MDKRRSAVVAVAVLLAVIAAVAVFVFLKDSDDSNSAGVGEQKVLVATSAIPANTKASQIVAGGLVRVESRPKNTVPVDAILSVDALSTASFAELVLGSDVPATTTITQGLFVNPGEKKASFNSALEPDQQLITVPAAQMKTLTSGLLKPGDRVNMIITTPSYQGGVDGGEAAPSGENADGTSTASQTTGYMLQGVEVYAVGATTATPLVSASAPGANGGTATTPSVTSMDITFRVGFVEAEKIVRALHGGATPGELWLTLVSQDFAKAPTAAITSRSLLTDNFVDGGVAKQPDAPKVETTSTTTTSAASGK